MKKTILAFGIALTMCASMSAAAFAGEAEPAAAADEAAAESVSFRACEHRDSYLLQDDSYEATDTEGGYRHYACSECGAEYSYATDPLVYGVNPNTGEPVTQQGASNPLYENWSFVPDGEPHVFWSRPDNEWRVFVYGSHDLDSVNMCDYDYILWSAPVYDMSSWRYEGVIFDVSGMEKPGKLCAPDCDYDVNTDTYYMIDNEAQPDNKSVIRAADNPCGPWNPEESVIEFRMRLAYDPAIYVEDGIIYVAGVAMKSGVEDGGRDDIVEKFAEDNYKAKHTLSVTKLKGSLKDGFEVDETVFPASDDNLYMAIYEGPSFGGWVDELGCYVMLYVSNEPSQEGATYHSTISYVYADDLMSDVWHYGENLVDDIVAYDGEEALSGNKGNVIFDASGRYHRNMETGEMEFIDIPTYMRGNNHGGMARINGLWYEFGHRPINNGGASRQGIAEKMNLYLAEDGTPVIEPVEYTSSGVADYLYAYEIWNANTACYLTAGIGIPAPEGGEGQETPEDFNSPYITQTRDPEATHASYITDLKSGSVAGFKYIGFGDEEKQAVMKILVNREEGFADGRVHVYINNPDPEKAGEEIGVIELTGETVEAGEEETASDGTVWHWVSGTMDKAVKGIVPVYLVFESETDGNICNFDQFTFE